MYKNIKFFSCLFLLMLGLSLAVRAQEQQTTLGLANDHYDRYEYQLAIPFYEKLAKKSNIKTTVLEKLAMSYLEVNNYEKAAAWYKVITQRKDADAESYLNYADMLKSVGDYVKAKEYYNLYSQRGTKSIKNKVLGVDSAMIWQTKPTGDTVKNLNVVNTSQSEWGAISNEARVLIFNSDSLRIGLFDKNYAINKNLYGRTGRRFQKIYQYSQASESPEFKQFSSVINGFRYHVGPIVFSNDYKTAYFTVTHSGLISHKKDRSHNFYGSRRLELFTSRYEKGSWQSPEAFKYNDVTKYSIGHATISNDEKVLYFVSDMPGGFGKTDIWFSEKMMDGSWSAPKNCGSEINTDDEEGFPILKAGILYFSSMGHPGMGGFDIFSSKGAKDQWGKVVNPQSPLNSSADDFYLFMKDEVNGYFSSNRKGGLGDDDIYTYHKHQDLMISAPEKPIVRVIPEALVARPEPGRRFIIYYDFDLSKIRNDAIPVLDTVAALMNRFPGMNISLSSHTDSRGKNAYNLLLSQNRATAAVAYLNKKGIAAKRITAKGYGEIQLVNQCKDGVYCSEAKHQLNRRTEVTIL